MNNKRRPFNAVLRDLANRPEHKEQFTLPNGELNGSELARELKCSQPTISRALKNPGYQPKKNLIDAVCRVFGVTPAQARGEDTLAAAPPDDGRLSSRARNMALRYEKLSTGDKKFIDEMIGRFEVSAQRQLQAG
jgi:transcriptional regulator with XRE-family HTH domain